MIWRKPPASTHPLFGTVAMDRAMIRAIRFVYFPRLGISRPFQGGFMSAESGIAIVPARPTLMLPVLYRVLKDVDFDGFSGFVGFPDFALPVLRIQEPPPTVGSRIEVEVPVSVRPFQRHLTPVQ